MALMILDAFTGNRIPIAIPPKTQPQLTRRQELDRTAGQHQ
jgi:hypothetical protein